MLLGMSFNRSSLTPASTGNYCSSLVHTWILAPNCQSLCKWTIGMFLGSSRWLKRIDLQHNYYCSLACKIQSCYRNSSSRSNQLCKFCRQRLELCHPCKLLDCTFQWHRGRSKPRKCLEGTHLLLGFGKSNRHRWSHKNCLQLTIHILTHKWRPLQCSIHLFLNTDPRHTPLVCITPWS